MRQDKDFEIRFGKSRSANYKQAVNLAKKFSDVTLIGSGSDENTIKIGSEEIFSKYKDFYSLLYIISGWRSTKITYKGVKTGHFQEFFRKFDQVLKCSDSYTTSINKEIYCNVNDAQEGWGCMLLTNIRRHISRNYNYDWRSKYWYEFGKFEDDKTWKIDKEQIKEQLRREAEDKKIEHCRHFSFDIIAKVVDKLPDAINLESDEGWKVVYKEDFVGTSIQKIPIGITHFVPSDHSKSREECQQWPKMSISVNDNSKEEEKKRFIPKITFDDIGGIETIIDQIREVIELPIKRPDIYQHLGIRPHKGILLYGDPGNGKTLIAKAIANEVKAHFIPISGSELLSKWYGESEENLRNVFNEARELQPAVIFFDEIDSVALKRSDDFSARIDAKFVSQLLALMDGIELYDNVTVIASTNRPELLDEALLRPGRFDYKIEILKPNEDGCYKILCIATRNMPIDASFDIRKFSSSVVGCSGSEIVFVVKEAAMNALKRSVKVRDVILEEIKSEIDFSSIKVSESDFNAAFDKLKKNIIQ